MTHNFDPMKPKSPSQEEMEFLLKQMKPNPSPRLYKRLERAPWYRNSSSVVIPRWGFAFLALSCLIFVVFIISPPLRAMARNWIQYFLPDNQDQMFVSIDQLTPRELFHYASHENFPYSIDQITSIADYQVSQPASLLPGMELIGARYESATQTVVLLYQGAGYNLFLSQRPIEAGQKYFSIGASAVVEEVNIGHIRAEYVAGGWANQQSLPAVEASTPTELWIEWDSTLPQYTLRWQSQGSTYQLRSTGSASPQKDELIALAQTIR
jgi:hypothetical protein